MPIIIPRKNEPYYEPPTDKRWNRSWLKGQHREKVKAPYHCVAIVDQDELLAIRQEKNSAEETIKLKKEEKQRFKAIEAFLKPINADTKGNI